MKSSNKKWILGLSAMALACGIGGFTAFSAGLSASASTKNAKATYSGSTESSATISSLSVEEFGCVEDFTDWFGFGHSNKDLTVSNYVTYNEASKSVTLKNTSGGGLDFRFHLDGIVDENPYCGKTELGNFEVKMTIKGIGVGANENVYFASRNEWDSSAAEYYKSKVSLLATTEGKYNLEATSYGGEVSYVRGDVIKGLASDGVTITVGFVNNHTYYYHGDFMSNGYNIVKTTGITANANSARDGNQTFALYLTGESQTEIEILDFEFTRLDTAFNLSATDTETEEFIQSRLTVESKTYDSYMEYDFTDLEDASKAKNQAFLDGLISGTDTYAASGTRYIQELTEMGLLMQNTTANSYGLNYLSLGTNQYVNSAIQLSLSVQTNTTFELYVRTGPAASRFTKDGYHLLIERVTAGNDPYTYLKLETRKGGWATLIPDNKLLQSGEVNLMLVTEKIEKNGVAYTQMSVYLDSADPILAGVTDESLSAENKCDAGLGNIAFGVRNQEASAGKAVIKKLAIFNDPTQASWPRKDYSGVAPIEKIDDMYYEFGAMDEGNEKANEFISKLQKVEFSPAAKPTIGVTGEGDVEIKHNALGQYFRTQYEFGAKSLKNYTVMMEIEVVEGSFVLGIRVPTFQDFSTGNTVYLQFNNPGTGAGIFVAMVKRTNGAYSSYFHSYETGATSICLRLVVDGGRISILVDDLPVLYNAYYLDNEGLVDYNIDGYNKYDTTVATSGGDFVMGVMNDMEGDMACTKIKRFAFYNGATPQENVDYNYPTADETTRAEALKKAQQNMKFTDGFYVSFTAMLELLKQYDGKTDFKVGDTIRVDIAEYVSFNVLSSELNVREMGGRGTYEEGTWAYTFQEEDRGATNSVFGFSITHPKANTPVVLRFKVNVAQEGGSVSGGTSGGNTSGGNTSGGNTSGGNTSGGNTSGGSTNNKPNGGSTSGGNTSGNDEGGCSGCGSVIDLASGGLFLLAAGVAVLLKKKRQ